MSSVAGPSSGWAALMLLSNFWNLMTSCLCLSAQHVFTDIYSLSSAPIPIQPKTLGSMLSIIDNLTITDKSPHTVRHNHWHTVSAEAFIYYQVLCKRIAKKFIVSRLLWCFWRASESVFRGIENWFCFRDILL